MNQTLRKPDGATKSLPTATAVDTGKSEKGAGKTVVQNTVAHLPQSQAEKKDNGNTGNGRKQALSLTPAELLEIWQQATLDLKKAGMPVSLGNKDTRCVVILAGVNFNSDTGNFELVNTGT